MLGQRINRHRKEGRGRGGEKTKKKKKKREVCLCVWVCGSVSLHFKRYSSMGVKAIFGEGLCQHR